MANTEEMSSEHFYEFLNSHKIKKVDKHKREYTHVSYGHPYGSYKIPDDEISIFLELYDKEVKKGTDLHIIERHREYSCIVIDIDEKYDPSIKERQHTEENIEYIIETYTNNITKIFNINRDDERLSAFIFEKDNVKIPKKGNEKYTKDGLHIMYPFIVSDKYAQFLLRNNVLKDFRENSDKLSNLPLKNDMSDVIDKAVIYSNGWFMYDSTKPNSERYKLKYIIKGDKTKETPDVYFENYYSSEVLKKYNLISEFFSIRKYTGRDTTEIREDVLNKIDSYKVIKKRKKKFKNTKNVNNDELDAMIDLLSEKRSNNYSTWVEVGLALYNIDPENDYYLELFIKFSKKSEKYIDGCCEKAWKNFSSRNDGLNIGSLYYFARTDNEEEYKRIKRIDLHNLIDTSIESASDYDLAKVLHSMFENQFICGSSKKTGAWFNFENHKWTKMETNAELYKKISTDMVEEYLRKLSTCNLIASNQDLTEEEREAAQNKSEKIFKIVQKLKTNNNKKSIMDECKMLFYKKDFINKLDENPYLIGFNNGIFDLKNFEFRDGRPDDYISMTSGIDYIPFDIDDSNWYDLNNFISTVFPDEDVKEYFLTFLATCLLGVNKEEKFRIWVGSGSNGKSKIEELFNLSFGEYCMKFPITLLTGKRAASNACSPEIIRSKGKRFCYFEEPNENEKINTGRLKEYTGGDKIEGRGLYQDNIEFKPQFKLSVLTNYLPEVPFNDQGIWRRFEVIEFKSKFKDNPSESERYEFPIDRSLSEKMPNWTELFMGLLIDKYFKSYKDNNFKMIVPEDVLKFTKKYQKESDQYSQFCDDVLIETNKMVDKIEITELHEVYKHWHEQNNNDNKWMSKTEFKKYLIKKFSKKVVKNKNIYGFSMNKEFSSIYTMDEPPSIEDSF